MQQRLRNRLVSLVDWPARSASTENSARVSSSAPTGADPAQSVRHGASGLGDHVRVAGVGLGLPGVQVDDAAHRQPRQIDHRDPEITGNRDGQGADRGGLVDTIGTGPSSDSPASTLRKLTSRWAAPCRAPACPSRRSRRRDARTCRRRGHRTPRTRSAGDQDRATIAPVSSGQADLEHPRRQPRYEQTTQVRSLSAVVGALRPRRQHPQTINDRGNKSYRNRRPASPARA